MSCSTMSLYCMFACMIYKQANMSMRSDLPMRRLVLALTPAQGSVLVLRNLFLIQ